MKHTSAALRLTLIAMFLLSACVEQTSVRRHAQFGTRMKAAESITLLPADAEAYTENASYTKTRQYDYEYYVQDRLNELFADALKAKHYTTRVISAADLKEKELYRMYDALMKRFQSAAVSASVPALIKIDKAYIYDKTITPEVADITSAIEGDVLGLIFIKENVKTGGAVARDFAMQIAMAALTGRSGDIGGADEVSRLYAGLIDGNTGEILWVNHTIKLDDTITSAFRRTGKSETDITDRNLTVIINALLETLPPKEALDKAQEESDAIIKKAEANAS